MNKKLKVLELFAGQRCIGKAFKEKGHEVFSVEWDKRHENIDWYEDIGKISAQDIVERFGVPDVCWASPECFPEGNLVWTSDGYKDIKDVECNDYVLTHKGNYKKVYRTIKSNKSEFYNIKISGCESFYVTPNHPFYVRKKKVTYPKIDGKRTMRIKLLEPEFIKAEDLTTEYKVGIPINQESIIPEWNGVIKYRCNSYGKTSSWIENTLSQYMGNSDFWWLVGRYFGDGYLSKAKTIVDICCAKDEDSEIEEHLDKLGLRYTYRQKEFTNSFMLSSKEICEFLSQFRIGSLNKTITPTILNLPVYLLRAFLEGYISADGHLNHSTKNPTYNISTVSKELAYGFQLCILKAYGRYASMVTRDNQTDVIQGRKVNVHKCYTLSFYRDDNPKRFQYKIEDGYAWVNIRKVEPYRCRQMSIYNISVEDDESYTINNVACHNCTTYSIAAISHHRTKEPDGNLAPKSDYAKFCDKVNQHVLEMMDEFSKMNPNMIWFIENPRGGLRKMRFMKKLPRYTVTYCQYGDERMKPTDIWTNHPNPKFKPMCKNGDPCHTPAPRGSKTGTQGRKGSVQRSLIPVGLCRHIVDICEEILCSPNGGDSDEI